ncbi:MAG: hypothetical protein HWQ35_18625 [Nostoc sp. NMS1]|nr:MULTISPECIES: hypothetical protein [unclassified Nostoc]MBN3908478.1 hypothetical protein [Nostoc sp. NMS1]MBN3994214.1 hypothetical protein [Nostoc sp. NMS2]
MCNFTLNWYNSAIAVAIALPILLVQHGVNKPPIPNQRNAYAVFIFNF